MSLVIHPLNSISFKSGSISKPDVKDPQNSNKQNPVSRKGETMNLIKATFIGGLGLGVRLLWEIFDGDFVFEKAGQTAQNIVDKTKKNVYGSKRTLLYIGAAAALIAAGISGFALLYTMLNAPKIAYKSKVNTFKKSKEMDVYIKSNEAEQDIYTQIAQKAKTADSEEKDKLKEQYMQMKMAKNQVPDFCKA